MYHPSPNVSRPVTQLTEEEQVKIAKRIGLIQHLPSGFYDGSKKAREYVLRQILIICTVLVINMFHCH
jgi:E3 ubiquitin-protein ligase RNF11